MALTYVEQKRFPFDLNAQLDFQFKWIRWMAGVNDNILTYAFTVDAGLEVVEHFLTGNIVTVFVRLNPLAPAQIGQRPQIHCDIVSARLPTPRRDRRSCELLIVPR